MFQLPLTSRLTYTPTFTYHGFRFVELSVVELSPDGTERPLQRMQGAALPFTAHLQAHRAHSDVQSIANVSLQQAKTAPASAIAASALIGKVFNATISSHVSNLWSIPTDCPQVRRIPIIPSANLIDILRYECPLTPRCLRLSCTHPPHVHF